MNEPGGFPSFPQEVRRKYEPLRLLGQGGEADVFLGRPRKGGDLAAIKVYRRPIDLALRAAFTTSRFARHVPHLLDYGNTEGMYGAMVGWEAQEYFDAGSLRQVMEKRGRLAEPEILEIVTELAGCVSFWQAEMRYNHTDINPENILVRSVRPYRFVIGDFGGAVRNSASQEIGTILAKIRYMAPEALQFRRGEPPVWWSVGVIVLELLTARSPYDGLAEAEVLVLLREGVIPDLSAITDARWRMLVQGLLTVDRHARWGHPQVAEWLAGRTPGIARTTRRFEPVVFAGTSHVEPDKLVLDMQDRWSLAVPWLLQGNAARLVEWIGRGFPDSGFDPAPLARLDGRPEAAHMALSALAAHFIPDRAPRYKGYVVDDAGLLSLARGAVEDSRVLREVLESGVLQYAARHECGHGRRCGDVCLVLERIREEAAGTVAEVVRRLGWLRPVIEQSIREPGGIPAAREMDLAWSAATELTVRPESVGGYLAGIRQATADTSWWVRERKAAHDADAETVAGRGRIVVAHLLAPHAGERAPGEAPQSAHPEATPDQAGHLREWAGRAGALRGGNLREQAGRAGAPRGGGFREWAGRAGVLRPGTLRELARRAGRCRRFAVPAIILGLADLLGSIVYGTPDRSVRSVADPIEAALSWTGIRGLAASASSVIPGTSGVLGALWPTLLLIAATSVASSKRLWRRPGLRVLAYWAAAALSVIVLIRLLATGLVPAGLGVHVLVSLPGRFLEAA